MTFDKSNPQIKKIPIEWKKANVYLIFKPKLWEFKMKNRRPIILLEPVRKLIMHILNKRLRLLKKINS